MSLSPRSLLVGLGFVALLLLVGLGYQFAAIAQLRKELAQSQQRLEVKATQPRATSKTVPFAQHEDIAAIRAELVQLKSELAQLRNQRASPTPSSDKTLSAPTRSVDPFSGFLTTAPPLIADKVRWDHGQVVGPPDTKRAGDFPTAWAPKSPRSGVQWLQVGYERTVEVKEINIHETNCPGSVSKVAALLPDGSEKVIWEGTAPLGANDIVETSIPVPKGITSRQIKVYIDTNRVTSWPEIDAVQLVGYDGTTQWAKESSASSSYSELYGR